MRLLVSILAFVIALGVFAGLASAHVSSSGSHDDDTALAETTLDDLDADGDDDNEDAEAASLELPGAPVDIASHTHTAHFRGYASPLPEPTTPPPRG